MNTVRSNVIDVALSPYTLASQDFKRRVIGNERILILARQKMMILQQPRIRRQSELYTHMPWEEKRENRTGQNRTGQRRIVNLDEH